MQIPKNRIGVFVYGSLRRRERYHGYLRKAVYLGVAHSEPSYALFDLGAYPAACFGGNQAIRGQIYLVDKKLLDRLDRLECCPQLYQRHQISTRFVFGMVYIYVQAPRGSRRLKCPDWRYRQR